MKELLPPFLVPQVPVHGAPPASTLASVMEKGIREDTLPALLVFSAGRMTAWIESFIPCWVSPLAEHICPGQSLLVPRSPCGLSEGDFDCREEEVGRRRHGQAQPRSLGVLCLTPEMLLGHVIQTDQASPRAGLGVNWQFPYLAGP